jgi:VWFA-related protein
MTRGVLALVIAATALAAAGQQPTSAPANTIWMTSNVIHRDGHMVANLTAADFAITDNGEPREIVSFRSDAVPVAIALMVDTSPSMESNYGLVRRAVIALSSHFEPGDRAILGSFDNLPWIGNRFSARPDVVQKSLVSVVGGTLNLCDGDWIDKAKLTRNWENKASFGSTTMFRARQTFKGGSAIWDGAACGINAVASDGETPRRVVVLLTDGVDNISSSNVSQVITRANRAGVIVYGIGLMGGYGMAGGELKSLAEATGGGYYYLTGEDKVADAFARIADELRHQYVFGFASNGPVDGAHQIVVTARTPETTTRSRRVYLDAPAGTVPIGRSSDAEAIGRPVAPPALPPSLALPNRLPGAAAPSSGSAAPAAARTPIWDDLDRFVSDRFLAGVAPRMTIAEMRTLLGSLKRGAAGWIAAAPPDDQPRRRLAVAAFVLDQLFTQNDPFLWTDKQPATDLIEWAAGIVAAGPPATEERLWYFAAIALFERGGAPDPLDRLVQRAMSRFPSEERWTLARAVAEDLRTWPEERDVRQFRVDAAVSARLVARYEAAALLPAVKHEALLRLGYFELRHGRAAAALARFDAAGPPDPADPILGFWMELFRGRALEQLNRLPEAIDSFQRALDLVPGAPSATSSLIAALTKARRPADAARLAAAALTTPAAPLDPWTIYVLPDFRFWPSISAQLRLAVER